MPIPTVIRSTDPGAPVLDGAAGSAYAVFKHILDIVGWTIEHDDPVNFKCVYRNNPLSGSGCYFRLHDDGSANRGTHRYAYVNMFEDMIDIDTGTGACFNGDGWLFNKSSNAATVRPWFAIADDRTVYICANYNSNMWFSQGFGDYHSFIPGMPGFMLTWGWTTASTPGVSSGAGWFSNSQSNRVSRNPSTLEETPTGFDVSHHPMVSAGSNPIGGAGVSVKPYDTRRYSTPMIMGNTTVGLLGVMRGAYVPFSPSNSLTPGSTFEASDGYSTMEYIVLQGQTNVSNTTGYSPGGCFILTGDWDA